METSKLWAHFLWTLIIVELVSACCMDGCCNCCSQRDCLPSPCCYGCCRQPSFLLLPKPFLQSCGQCTPGVPPRCLGLPCGLGSRVPSHCFPSPPIWGPRAPTQNVFPPNVWPPRIPGQCLSPPNVWTPPIGLPNPWAPPRCIAPPVYYPPQFPGGPSIWGPPSTGPILPPYFPGHPYYIYPRPSTPKPPRKCEWTCNCSFPKPKGGTSKGSSKSCCFFVCPNCGTQMKVCTECPPTCKSPHPKTSQPLYYFFQKCKWGKHPPKCTGPPLTCESCSC